MPTDPFERAVARERRLRDRAGALDSRASLIRLATGVVVALAIGWTALVAVHWTLFEEPRWLLLAHTLAYALVVGYWCITMMFLIYMRRRRPDWFGG